MVETGSVGVTNDSTYRYTENDGWFTYRMAVDESAPLLRLHIKLRKADNGKSLRVRVGDAVLWAGTLSYSSFSTRDSSVCASLSRPIPT